MRPLFLALLILAVAAVPAQATYAGKNGRIVVSSNRTGSWQLHSVRPDGTGITQITSLPDDRSRLVRQRLPARTSRPTAAASSSRTTSTVTSSCSS